LKNVLLVLSLLLCSFSSYALTIKVGVLAPEGTNWSKGLKKMAKEIKKATNKDVKFKIYFGGSQGDEKDVLRKIRVGQLHGGVFTGKTLGEIDGNVRVMEIPFTFGSNREKAWKVLNKLAPHFDQNFTKKKFKNLGLFEIGMVYFVSQKKNSSLDSLKGLKIWSWEGDELVESMIKTMDLVSVPLPLPDVLSSLSTGVIQAAYAPPLGIVALQWNTKIKYLVDFPLSYSVGAFLINDKQWKKIAPANQKIIETISKKYVAQINKKNIQDNVDSLKALKNLGIEFLKFPDKDEQRGAEIRKKIVGKLKGKLFTEKSLKMLEKEI
jgi:TRAP-type transport system periplasmic protein